MSQFSYRPNRLEQRSQRFYQESGVVPFSAVHVTLLLGLLAALVIAPVAILACGLLLAMTALFVFVAIPLAFLIPFLHGYMVCWIVTSTANRWRVRNQKFTTCICVICVIFAFYCILHSLTWALNGLVWREYFLLLNPLELGTVLTQWLQQQPIWLLVILAIAFAFTIISYFGGLNAIHQTIVPFCEDCNCLCNTHPEKLHFLHLRPSWLRRDDFQDFWGIVELTDQRFVYRSLFYFCPECLLTSYVRVWRVRRRHGKKSSEDYTEIDRLVYNLLIAPRELKSLFDTVETRET